MNILFVLAKFKEKREILRTKTSVSTQHVIELYIKQIGYSNININTNTNNSKHLQFHDTSTTIISILVLLYIFICREFSRLVHACTCMQAQTARKEQ
jgi:hypothetical protein